MLVSYIRLSDSTHRSRSCSASLGEFLANVLRLGLAVLRPIRIPIRAVKFALGAFASLLAAADALEAVGLVISPVHLQDLVLLDSTAHPRLRLTIFEQGMQPSVELRQLFRWQRADWLFDLT